MRPAVRLAIVFGLVGLGIALLLFGGVFAQSPEVRAQTGPTATPTRAAYPLPATATPSATPTATPKGGRPPTSTPTRLPSPTPTIGFSPFVSTTGPYSVYLPLVMSNQPLAACAPNTDGLGLEPFWPYQSFALSDRLSLRVNLCNGNLVVQYGAFDLPGRGLPLALAETYNSGSGQWLHSLGAHLWLIDSSGSVSLQDADGTARTFTANGDGSFTAPAGVYDRLVQNGDGTYSLTQPDQRVEAFDATGVLTQTRDRFGNAINLTYSGGLLAQAQAAGGQALSFTYTDGSLTAIADTAGHTFTLGYSGGWLSTLSDPVGAAYMLAYTNSLLASLTDPRGVQTTLGYDPQKRLQSIAVANTPIASFAYLTGTSVFSDANNYPTTYAFNSSGQAVVITDALTNHTSFAYDANYNVVQMTDALGRVSRAAFDGTGNVISRTDALSGTTLYAYNTTNDLTSLMDALSRQTAYGYDASGNLTVITDALGVTTTFGYDGYGQRTRATDGNGHSTLYAYSSAGYLITTTDALSNRVVAAYDAVGNRTSVTDPRSNTTSYTYDAANRLLAVTAPLTVGLSAVTRYGYDSVGNRTVITDANVHTTTFGYDALNRTVGITDALGHRSQYGYDPAGNRTSVTDANTHITHYGYDRLNRTIAITDALGNYTYFGYDLVGNRTSVTDPNGHTTTVGYDALNRVLTTSVPLTVGQFALTQYQYDALGNRTVMTDANTHPTQYGYDRLNRTVAITDSLLHTTTVGYDRAGNRIALTDTAGFTTTFGYDALNRVLTTTNPAGASQSVTYDAAGNRLTSTDELGRVTRSVYDQANRLVAQTDALTQTTAYAYDAVGNLTRLEGPRTGGITLTFGLTYTYDAANRLTAKQTLLGTTSYAYDGAANLLTLTDPSGAYSAFTYDGTNRLTQQDDHAVGGGLTVSSTLAYDPNGNRTNTTEYYATFSRSTDSTYDHANRLVSESGPGGMTGYTYDAVGNRTGTTDPLGVTTVVTPNALNLPVQTTHWQNASLLDATSTTYDTRNNPQLRTTISGTLNLTTAYAFNNNDYLGVLQDANLSNSHTYTMTYSDDNLVRTNHSSITSDDYVVYYDDANRVGCYKNRTSVAMKAWTYYPDGNRQYSYQGYHPMHVCPPAEDLAPHLGDLTTRFEYVYQGQRLMQRNWQDYNGAYLSVTTDFAYDAGGRLTQTTNVDYAHNSITTTNYGWRWQASAERLIAVTTTAGLTTTFDYDYAGRIIRRSTALGYSDYIYEGNTDWLLRETWHVTTTYDLARYFYDNGRLARVEYLNDANDLTKGYTTAQVQFNWHGDAVMAIGPSGYGYTPLSTQIGPATFDPWGNADYGGDAPTWANYHWNAACGYLWFTDLGLYYVHGRWYSPDLGRFISPDERGEYLYGSGDDAVNFGWIAGGGPWYTGDPWLMLPQEYRNCRSDLRCIQARAWWMINFYSAKATAFGGYEQLSVLDKADYEFFVGEGISTQPWLPHNERLFQSLWEQEYSNYVAMSTVLWTMGGGPQRMVNAMMGNGPLTGTEIRILQGRSFPVSGNSAANIAPFVRGGGAGAGGQVSLFRAVSRAELDDIQQFGGFRPGPGTYENKLFAESLNDADWWGRSLYQANGERFYIVEATIPRSLSNKLLYMPMDFRMVVVVDYGQLSEFNAVVQIRIVR